MVALVPIGNGCGTIPAGATFRVTNEVEARVYKDQGRAVPAEGHRLWSGPQWTGATVAIIVSGESLTQQDCDLVRVWRDRAPAVRRVITVNTSFRRAPWADLIYACDAPWWRIYGEECRAACAGELWTQDRAAVHLHERMRWVESAHLPGLSKKPGVIHQGMNTGYQAIGLAHLTEATRLVLLGFDMRGGHWHGAHAKPLSNPTPPMFELWLGLFPRLAQDLRAAGVDVVNCTRSTALTAFRLGVLEEELDDRDLQNQDRAHLPA